jgi:hypothetical protein
MYRTAPISARYNGIFNNQVDGTQDLYASGVKVGTLGANVNFPLEVEFAGNVHFQSTVEAGADGVGADGEQLTSGGAGAGTDWATA